ncbi:MAG: rhodanese-like domain-containing protein [Alphaproteobacteria bacterium]|nr:rhodanese-like domain-containing protein [Alphaproteobacteria bacterium]
MAPHDIFQGYAGELTPKEAWALLSAHRDAQLVDVRTNVEWTFVGVPDLSALDRQTHCLEWQTYPAMATNPAFAAQTDAALHGRKDAPVLFLCRSGARSRAAACAMTAAGYTKAYNITDGFEGPMDAHGHRGSISGWKACGLPWKQT